MLPADLQFGHRTANGADGRRLVVELAPPDSTRPHFEYPAIYDSVYVRVAPFDASRSADVQQVPVEVLVKGSLPDVCTELHELRQRRIGHLVEVALRMQRPIGAVCRLISQPYRYYFTLEGEYGPGAYVLKLNGRIHTFTVRAPSK